MTQGWAATVAQIAKRVFCHTVTALKDKTCHLLLLKVPTPSEVRGTSPLLSSTTPTAATSPPIAHESLLFFQHSYA